MIKNIATISPRELQERLTAEPDLAVLDVRSPVEFDEVHALRARNEPLDRLKPKALFDPGLLSQDRPFYLLCRTTSRAEIAAKEFEKAGYRNAVVVEGGTLGWVESGLPVLRGQTKVISLERQVRIAAGSLVLIGALLGWFVHPAFFGLSAFVGAGLVFAGITDFCGLGLLLLRFPWNRRRSA